MEKKNQDNNKKRIELIRQGLENKIYHQEQYLDEQGITNYDNKEKTGELAKILENTDELVQEDLDTIQIVNESEINLEIDDEYIMEKYNNYLHTPRTETKKEETFEEDLTKKIDSENPVEEIEIISEEQVIINEESEKTQNLEVQNSETENLSAENIDTENLYFDDQLDDLQEELKLLQKSKKIVTESPSLVVEVHEEEENQELESTQKLSIKDDDKKRIDFLSVFLIIIIVVLVIIIKNLIF